MATEFTKTTKPLLAITQELQLQPAAIQLLLNYKTLVAQTKLVLEPEFAAIKPLLVAQTVIAVDQDTPDQLIAMAIISGKISLLTLV